MKTNKFSLRYKNIHQLLSPEEHQAIEQELLEEAEKQHKAEKRDRRAEKRAQEKRLMLCITEDDTGSDFILRSPPRSIITSKIKTPKGESYTLRLPDTTSDTSSPSDSDCSLSIARRTMLA